MSFWVGPNRFMQKPSWLTNLYLVPLIGSGFHPCAMLLGSHGIWRIAAPKLADSAARHSPVFALLMDLKTPAAVAGEATVSVVDAPMTTASSAERAFGHDTSDVFLINRTSFLPASLS
ncbi:MAG TPA: hypothetical protein VFC19_30210 [Candidatus Limnocylindrales bacterium]|nr:hypothetical protein [Candidatus Limnocylindrales bacterium]